MTPPNNPKRDLKEIVFEACRDWWADCWDKTADEELLDFLYWTFSKGDPNGNQK